MVVHPGQIITFGVLVIVEGGIPIEPNENPGKKGENHRQIQPSEGTKIR